MMNSDGMTYAAAPPCRDFPPLWGGLWRNLAGRVLRMARSFAGSAGQSGDSGGRCLEAVFLEAVERYGGVIDRVCWSFARNAADCQDLRQDVLVNIWRGMKTFRGESELRTWIYRVVMNTCVSTWRRRPSGIRIERLEERVEIADGRGERYESAQLLQTLLRALPPVEHAVMVMWLDDMGYDDIAGVMGMNRDTVGTKINRARRRMREMYMKIKD